MSTKKTPVKMKTRTALKSHQVEWGIWDNLREDVSVDKLEDESLESDILSGQNLTIGFAKKLNLKLRRHEILTDSLRNFNKMSLVSKELKEFLESKEVTQVEFFPVGLKYEGKAFKGDKSYFLMNILENVDCLDEKKSYSGVDLKKIVLDEAKLPTNRLLFRSKPFTFRKVEPLKWKSPIFIQKYLADEVKKSKLIGPTYLTFKQFVDATY
jgi:hypothetical protein